MATGSTASDNNPKKWNPWSIWSQAPDATSVIETHTNQDSNKISINVSDWLMLGSALSLSSAMGVIVLNLAGRISFTKPFGTSVVSAVVLSFLGVIYKDQTVDAAPIVKQIKRIIPSSSTLDEGSFFDYDGQKYYIARTVADGACALHAVLGSKESGSYRRADARQHYTEKLYQKLEDPLFSEKWKEWMIHFVKDYLSPNPGRYSKLVFNQQLVANLNEELAQLEAKRSALKEQQEELFDKALDLEEVRSKLKELILGEEVRRSLANGMLQQQLEERVFAYAKMRESLNEIIQLIIQNPIGQAIQQNQDALNRMDEERAECYRRCIERPEILEAYVEGVQRWDYYFATQEIGLMAHLFDLRITVFHQLPSEEVDIVTEEGARESEPVAIFHKGIHFSHCELQKRL